MDIGAGEGNMTVAFVETHNRSCLAAFHDPTDAKKMLDAIDSMSIHGRLHLVLADATTHFLKRESVDQVLLIDVLEHIKDEDAVLTSVSHALRSKGFLVLSVPTENYASYFGKKYDNMIGHIRHYSPQQLDVILKRCGFDIVRWEYHTKARTARLCSLWYRKIPELEGIDYYVYMLALPIFKTLSLFDTLRHSKDTETGRTAAGIVMLARKKS